MHKDAHVLLWCMTHPWAIMPEVGEVIASVLARHVAGIETPQATIDAAMATRSEPTQPRVGSVAVLPVYGVIAPRMNMLSEISGGTTYDQLAKQLRGLVANRDVQAIVLDVNSPGGSVAGNAEFAAEIMEAKAVKPIIAQAQFTMGSAAYQIGAAATEIVAAPSARVGSIGTYVIHDDISKALEQRGIKRTFISAGEGKVDGNEAEPLSPSARARLEAWANEAYEQFVGNVVAGRGRSLTAAKVKDEWKALTYGAPEALRIGMIDRVATLDQTIASLLSSSKDPADRRLAGQLVATAPQVTATRATPAFDPAALELQRKAFALQLTTHS